MSWFKENYEKAALAIACLLFIIIFSYFAVGEKSNVKPLRVSIDNTIDENSFNEISKILEKRKNISEIRTKFVGMREITLFIGPNLFIKRNSDKPTDLYIDSNVHDGIPNEWWRKHNIDIGYANSPERDEDKDGFTNREEFDNKTNPSDAGSYPSLLGKVIGKNISLFKMQMRWNSFDDNSITIYYRDTKPTRLFGQRVFYGSIFYENKGERFKLSERPFNLMGPNGRQQEVFEVEDRLPRYKNTPRQFFKLFRKGAKSEGYNEIQDRSVFLQLNALGRQGETFEINEFEKFSLPYNPDAITKPYQVTKIDPVKGQENMYEIEITEKSDATINKKAIFIIKK